MSAPRDNQNAAKESADRADSHLHLRVTRRDKARWVRAARKSPTRKLAPWVIAALNDQAP